MFLPLVCLATHEAIPALVPGDHLTLSGQAGALTLTMLVTENVMRRLGDAIRAGALAIEPGGPSFEDLAAHIEAEHRDLMARLAAAVEARRAAGHRAATPAAA